MSKFCIAPWASIAVKNDGKIKPCCAYRGDMGDLLKGDTLESAWKSEKMISLREKLDTGIFPTECRICEQMEKFSGQSRRLQLLEKIEPFNVSDNTNPEFKLRHFDVNFSNICNLKCVMCDGVTSSAWQPNEEQLNLKFRSFQNFSITDFSFDDFNFPLDDLQRIDFRGGEPLMSEKHFQFLELLIQKGLAKDITLGYITNGTKRPKICETLFPYFKNIIMNISFEAVGPLYKYIRGWHYDITEVEKAVKFFNQFENLYGGFLCCFQAYNVFEYIKIYEYILKISNGTRFSIKDFHELVLDPDYISYKVLPMPFRMVAIKEMEKSNYKELKPLINTLKTENYDLELHRNFIEYTKELDRIRNVNLLEVEPRFKEIFNE